MKGGGREEVDPPRSPRAPREEGEKAILGVINLICMSLGSKI
jgi:hypothetical protein